MNSNYFHLPEHEGEFPTDIPVIDELAPYSENATESPNLQIISISDRLNFLRDEVEKMQRLLENLESGGLDSLISNIQKESLLATGSTGDLTPVDPLEFQLSSPNLEDLADIERAELSGTQVLKSKEGNLVVAPFGSAATSDEVEDTPIAILINSNTSQIPGGEATPNEWNFRPLTQVESESEFCTLLDDGSIKLAPGRYWVMGIATAGCVTNHCAALYNRTTDEYYCGSAERGAFFENPQMSRLKNTVSTIIQSIIIDQESTLDFVHYVEDCKSEYALGVPIKDIDQQVYIQLVIGKN